MKKCYSCFKEYDEQYEVCPHCGYIEHTKAGEPIYLPPGSTLSQGRYTVGERIGSGGFGIVYKAWDNKLDQLVAIKEFFASRIMSRAEGSRKVVFLKKTEEECHYRMERFLAEARTMARFSSHRNITNVQEYFEENGTAYIVMELLEGMTLGAYMKQCGGSIDPEFAIEVTLEVAAALASLHEQGIVHRDVSPDNIFINSGRELKIKLMDFGAAILKDGTDSAVDIVLKPGYSPPEQYEKAGNIGPWTDIYALGATLYAMLTGQKPADAASRKIKDDLKSPGELNSSISENLSNTVMKALSMDLNLRFRKDNDFISAIKGNIKVVTLKEEKRKRNIKRAAGIAAAFAVVCVGLLIVLLLLQNKVEKEMLLPGTVSIWYSAEADDGEDIAMQMIVKDITNPENGFTNVDIILRAIPEESYGSVLEEAAEKGQLPSLFESTGLSEKVLSQAESLENITYSRHFTDVPLLVKYYDASYKDGKKLPLAVNIPMAAIVTGKSDISIRVDKDSFEDIADLASLGDMAVDSHAYKLWKENYPSMGQAEDYRSADSFLGNKEGRGPEVPMYLTDTMGYYAVKESEFSYATEKKYLFSDKDPVICEFTFEWSINKNKSRNEILNAEKILSWMLGETYQNFLMVELVHDGHIPVNKDSFIYFGQRSNDLKIGEGLYNRLEVR